MKKFLCAFIAIVMLIGVALPALAVVPVADDIPSKHVLLMEASSKTVLFEKSGYDTAYPASTTKIVTLILALENGNLDDKVTVPDVTTSGSVMGLSKGETLSLRSLCYGMMLHSGNDAAESIATHIAGSKAEFVDMMNAKAAELGMTNTHFVTPSGLDKEGHQTTAYDFALLTSYALLESPKKEDFRAIVKRGKYTVDDSSKKVYELENTNKLINTKTKNGVLAESFEYQYAIGVKTGDTPNAQRCLVAAAEKDGITLVSVQFYDLEEDYRFKLAAQLFDWGFENFHTQSAAALNLPAAINVKVANSSFEDEANGDLVLNVDLDGKNISGLSDRLEAIQNNLGSITTTVLPVNGEVTAPVKSGDLVATVAYKYEGETLFTANAYASRSVEVMGTSPSPTLDISGQPQPKRTAGPWLFIGLILGAIVLIAGVVFVLRNRRRKQRKRTRRNVYSYRGRN